jgi:DNA polymerase-3 subunit epsilon
MRILFLDTETNGLPINRHAPYTDVANWPAIIQIAWQVWDTSPDSTRPPVPLQIVSMILKPASDLVWNAESEAIHRISRETAERVGVPARNAIKLLSADAKECDLVVIHNLAFDKPVLFAAAIRAGLEKPERWWPRQELCFMLATKPICRIPSTSKYATPADPYKWPRLSEVWAYLFPDQSAPTDLHDAGADVTCLVNCFHELHRRRLVRLVVEERCGDRFVDLFRRVLFALRP